MAVFGVFEPFKGYSHSIMEAPLPAGPPIPGRLPGYHLGYRGSGAHPPMSFVRATQIPSTPSHASRRTKITTLRLVVNHRFQKSVLVFSSKALYLCIENLLGAYFRPKNPKKPLKYPFLTLFWTPPKTPKKPHFFEQIFGLFSCPIIKCAKSGGTQNAVGSQFIQVLSSVKWPFLGFLGFLRAIAILLWRPPASWPSHTR